LLYHFHRSKLFQSRFFFAIFNSSPSSAFTSQMSASVIFQYIATALYPDVFKSPLQHSSIRQVHEEVRHGLPNGTIACVNGICPQTYIPTCDFLAYVEHICLLFSEKGNCKSYIIIFLTLYKTCYCVKARERQNVEYIVFNVVYGSKRIFGLNSVCIVKFTP